MVDPRTDEDRIRGIVQAADMAPIPTFAPWGTFNSSSGSAVSVAATTNNVLASYNAEGWIFAVLAKFNSSLFRLDITVDGQLVYPNMTVKELFNDYGLEQQNNLPFVTAYDTTNNIYVVTFDPPNYLHFKNSVSIEAYNTDSTSHNIDKYSASLIEYG